MTCREVMELADVIRDAGFDWDAFIGECQENEEEPHLSYDDFLAQSILESGYHKEREERSKGCRCCLDASIDPDLEGCDLSYHTVGDAEQWHRIMIRSGAGKPMAVMSEEWSGKMWNTVGIYEPKFCPECGRKLKTAMPGEEV